MNKINKMNLMVDPCVMFPKVEKMIYSQAWKFAKKYPITFEEAKAEAYYGFIRACYKYTPGKQKFSSWCYFLVWVTLQDLIIARTKDPIILVDPIPRTEAERRETEELMGVVSQESETFKEVMEDAVSGLSMEAREMLKLLMEPPVEVLGGKCYTPKQLMQKIKQHLLTKGRGRDQLKMAYTELEGCLKVALT